MKPTVAFWIPAITLAVSQLVGVILAVISPIDINYFAYNKWSYMITYASGSTIYCYAIYRNLEEFNANLISKLTKIGLLVSFLLLEYRVLDFCIINSYAIYPYSRDGWITPDTFSVCTKTVTAILFYGSIQAINSVNLELLRIFSILHTKVTKPVVLFVEYFWILVYVVYAICNLISLPFSLEGSFVPFVDVLKTVHFIIFTLVSSYDGICFCYLCHGYG